MNITDVKVFPVDEEKLKAYATITFDNCFIVRDLKVISGNKGYFIAMPSKKRKDGTFRDVAHPLNSETRKMIEDAVLDVYEKETGTAAPAAPPEAETGAGPMAPPPATAPEPPAESEPAVEPEPVTASEQAAETEPAVEPEPVTASEQAAETEPAPEPEAPLEEESTEIDSPEEPALKDQGPTDNPEIEPSDDPEKAFGYEE